MTAPTKLIRASWKAQLHLLSIKTNKNAQIKIKVVTKSLCEINSPAESCIRRKFSELLKTLTGLTFSLKALSNEDILLRTHCCSWCFLGCANWKTFVADTKCFWTKSETFFVSRTQNLCPQQMLPVQANGEKFVSATMCPQQCVLVCQGLYFLVI